jgi:catechol 2,3-dioxygenase-like lactoylglutathione lyase family enzyme
MVVAVKDSQELAMVKTTGVVEIALMVADIQASRVFYTDGIGLKVISPDFGGPTTGMTIL